MFVGRYSDIGSNRLQVAESTVSFELVWMTLDDRSVRFARRQEWSAPGIL